LDIKIGKTARLQRKREEKNNLTGAPGDNLHKIRDGDQPFLASRHGGRGGGGKKKQKAKSRIKKISAGWSLTNIKTTILLEDD